MYKSNCIINYLLCLGYDALFSDKLLNTHFSIFYKLIYNSNTCNELSQNIYLFIYFYIAFMCFVLFKRISSTMALFREKSDRVKTPALFPCAAKVKIPQLGSEETNFELKLSHKPAPSSVIFKSFQAPEPVQRSYLKRISADLSFSEDVVHDRCFHMVPYDRKYLFQALDPCKYFIYSFLRMSGIKLLWSDIYFVSYSAYCRSSSLPKCLIRIPLIFA